MKKLLLFLAVFSANIALGQRLEVKQYQEVNLRLQVSKEQKQTGLLFMAIGAVLVVQSQQKSDIQGFLFVAGASGIFYGHTLRLDADKILFNRNK